MRKFVQVAAGIGILLNAAVLVSLGLALFSLDAGWLLLIPAALIAAFAIFAAFGLRGSRGGFLAFTAGQLPPRMRRVPRQVHAVDVHPEVEVEIHIDPKDVVASLPPFYLSAAVDLSQVVGGKWWDPKANHIELSSGSLKAPVFDFDRPLLNRLTAALAPLVLRVGGSESDKIYYALDDDQTTAPQGYESVLKRAQWEGMQAFCQRNDCQLMFTLNYGPAVRKPDGSWNAENARQLMAFTQAMGGKVAAWELGNELNVFFFVHGLQRTVPVNQYTQDLKTLRGLMAQYTPEAQLAGQGSAFWPVLGEPLGYFFGYTRPMLEQAGSLLDVALWHYYPQQSRRCPFGSRRAHPARLLEPDHLDEAAHWADQIHAWREQYAPHLPLWLGESGNAQCGGAPGVSDAYLAGLWWLDELGLMARHGNQVVVRQSLTGMNYGLLDEQTLAPRPDYWNSLLWRRLMGSQVYTLTSRGSDKVRVYAHSSAQGEGMTVLAVNLDPFKAAYLRLPQAGAKRAQQYLLTAPDVLGGEVHLNGNPLALTSSGDLPALQGVPALAGEGLRLPPLSYGFWVVEG